MTLPISFMATMMQLPIAQYKRTDDKLDLGYVAGIMCKSPDNFLYELRPLMISSPNIYFCLRCAHRDRFQSRARGVIFPDG